MNMKQYMIAFFIIFLAWFLECQKKIFQAENDALVERMVAFSEMPHQFVEVK